MKFAIAIGCLVLVACGPKYQYVQRDGATLRIDDKGHVAVLRVQSGTSEWVAIKTAQEIKADTEKERARCAERTLPPEAQQAVSLSNGDNGWLQVSNGSAWCVREIRFKDGSVARPRDTSTPEERGNWLMRPITHTCPGTKLEFEFDAATGKTTDGTVYVKEMVGVPATCPTT